MRLARVLQFVLGQCWALEPGFHSRLLALLQDRTDVDAERLAKAIAAAAPGAEPFDARGAGQGMRRDKGVAIIPIRGVIAQRASQVDPVCSDVGTSVEHIRNDLTAAMADDTVQAIVLEVDSPGGSVSGLDDLAGDLREARARKPIVAHSDGMMASAAYWLAAQADKVYATRDAVVGSIGVIAGFLDNHRRLQAAGVDPVVIKSTPGKGHVGTTGTFGDDNRAAVQAEVDQFHRMFVDAVAAGRRVTGERAAEMGDGRTRIGAKAEADGFVDGVRSLGAAVKAARQLVRAAATPAPAAAAASDGPMPGGPLHDGLATWPAPAAETDPTTEARQANAAAELDPPDATAADGTTDEDETMTTKETVPATPAPAAANPAPATTYETIKAERDRAAAIHRAAIPEQRELEARLIAEGTPTAEALAELNADLRARLEQAKTLPAAQHAPLARGNTATVAGSTGAAAAAAAVDELEGEALWRATYAKDKATRAEFEQLAAMSTQITVRNEDGTRRAVTGLDLYMASMRNEGKARVVSSRDAIAKDAADAVPMA